MQGGWVVNVKEGLGGSDVEWYHMICDGMLYDRDDVLIMLLNKFLRLLHISLLFGLLNCIGL